MSNVKRDRFLKIAETRTNKILEMIKLLGNCSNKSSYEYTDEEVRKIFAAIDKELKICKSRFSSPDDSEEKFRLA